MKARVCVFVIFAVFLADQISKWWVVERIIKPLALPARDDPSALPFISWLTMPQGQMPFAAVPVFPFFNVVMVWNKGVSFGMLNGHGLGGTVILSVVALAIIGAFTVWLVRSRSLLLSLALSAIIGGALGNIADRWRFGAVADFLDFHALGLHFWAFNIADAAISLGIAMVLVHSLFFDVKNKQANPL